MSVCLTCGHEANCTCSPFEKNPLITADDLDAFSKAMNEPIGCNECQSLRAENEQLRVQLAGCGVAALGYATGKNAVKPGDYGHSASYDDVMRLKAQLAQAQSEAQAERHERERVQADAAAYRASLEKLRDFFDEDILSTEEDRPCEMDYWDYCHIPHYTLLSPAGSALLERMRLLEAVADAAKDCIGQYQPEFVTQHNLYRAVHDALAALDAQREGGCS